MIRVSRIKGSNRAAVDYYLSRAALDEEPRTRDERAAAMGRYYGGHSANGPGRWLGRGGEALGLAGQAATPEAFAAAVLDGYLDGQAHARRQLRTHPDGMVAAAPVAEAVRQVAAERGVEPAELFTSGRGAGDWHRVARAADKYETVSAEAVQRVARRVGGIDPGELYGDAEWARAVKMAGPGYRIDDRTAAEDLTVSVPKSVSLLYAMTTDESVRATILEEFHAAVRSTLDGFFDPLIAEGVRGSKSRGTASEIATEGLVAVGFVHDEARPSTAECKCGDPHLHEHVVTMNLARGVDGRWSATQQDRLPSAAKTGGHLFHAELRRRLSERLGVQWRPVVEGMADLAGFDDAQLRHFSKRGDDIETEMREAGVEGLAAHDVAHGNTKHAKRAQLPLDERLALWREEAEEVGLTVERVDAVTGRRATAQSCAVDAAILDRLTQAASTFTRNDLLRALADDARQGAAVTELTARADAILDDPQLVVALGERQGGLTLSDVRGGAYDIAAKYTTPAQLQLEERLVDGALARVGEGCAQLDPSHVEQVIARQPLRLSDEQAAAVRGITTDGHGVEVLHAGAGTGKTSAVLDVARQAYEQSGFRVVGAANNASAARVLSDEAAISATTVAQTLIDLRREQLGPRTVMVLDESSVIGTRDLVPLLDHARDAGAKVLVTGDTRQLSAVDAGGGLRGLVDRLDAHQLTANRRQREGWERDALQDLAAGRPGPALRAYDAHGRVTVTDSALAARRAAVGAWWADVAEHGIDRTLLLAVRRVDVAELNAAARGIMREVGRLGDVELHAAGHSFATGDRVVALRNNRAIGLDNGDVGTVVRLDEGRRMAVRLDRGPTVTLPASYLDAGRVDHGYATTVHKSQGRTVDTAHVLGTALDKESGYVALSRGRAENRIYLVQGEPQPEIDLPRQPQRDAYAQAVKDLDRSREKRLALDERPTTDAGRKVAALRGVAWRAKAAERAATVAGPEPPATVAAVQRAEPVLTRRAARR